MGESVDEFSICRDGDEFSVCRRTATTASSADDEFSICPRTATTAHNSMRIIILRLNCRDGDEFSIYLSTNFNHKIEDRRPP